MTDPTGPQKQENIASQPEGASAPTIRTMESDVESLFKTTKPSVIQMIGKEEKTLERLARRGINFKKYAVWLAAGLIGLIVLASVSYFVFYWFVATTTPGEKEKLSPPAPFFAVESTKIISVDAKTPGQLINLIKSIYTAPERAGIIKNVIIGIQGETEEHFLTLSELFNLYKINPSPDFLGKIDPVPMLFFYYQDGGARFGFAAKTRDSGRTFAKLINWEPTLIQDLSPLFFGKIPENTNLPFEDRTTRNIDWRFFKASSQTDLGIAYTVFQADNLLIITTSQESMEKIIGRLFNRR